MNSLGISPMLGFISEYTHRWNQMQPMQRNLVLALVVLGLLTLSLAVWALFFHTPSGLRKGRHSSRKDEKEKRRRKRKRRSEHRTINPTLAQTGGLPPAREPGAGPRPEAGP